MGGVKVHATGRVVVFGGVEHDDPEMLVHVARGYALEYVNAGDYDESYFDDQVSDERARALTIAQATVRADVAANPELIQITLGALAS